MAATVTTRLSPGGTKLGDGYQTLIAFAADPDIEFFEKTVTPPGLDGGDPTDTTTMHNLVWRTKVSRALIEMTDSTLTVAYDPLVLDSIVALINVEDDVTINHSNGDKWTFFGFLKSFIPGESAEGSQPEATITIVTTNFDPVDKIEAGPNFISALGTGS